MQNHQNISPAYQTIRLIVYLILLAGCGPGQSLGPTLTPTPTYTDTPTQTPIPPTNTATAANTLLPTSTATASRTPTPSLTSTMTPIPFSWEEVDPSGQTVVFWHHHTYIQADTMQRIVADFNTNNEWGITVILEFQGNYSEIFDKMLSVLTTSEAPNLVVAYQNQAATYQLATGLTDLTPLVESARWGFSQAELDDFYPGIFAQDIYPAYENARLGFPTYRALEVMYYNLDWLAELQESGALDFSGPPTTPEQFRQAACAAAQQPFSKAMEGNPIGYELNPDASRLASWTYSHGGDVFDDQGYRYTYDCHAASEAMTFLQGLFDSGCAATVTERYGDQDNFGNGRTLFTVASSSGIPYYQSAVNKGARFKWAVGAVPYTTSQPLVNAYSASLSIPIAEPERQLAAWLFLKHLTSPEVQAEWTQASNYFPVRASALEYLGSYIIRNQIATFVFEMLPYTYYEPRVPGYDWVRSRAQEALEKIVDGEEVDATLFSLNADANSNLSEQMEGLFAPQEPRRDSP